MFVNGVSGYQFDSWALHEPFLVRINGNEREARVGRGRRGDEL